MSSRTYPKESSFSKYFVSIKFIVIYKKVQLFVKRVFDISMALIGLIILSPVFIYISILIKRDSPGPIFFRGERLGKGGKPFSILKFRTMYESKESYLGPRITANGDDRITPLGQWLRDSKINELPQLWNVLIGDMSLVGPRPEDLEIARTWAEDAFEEITSINPGITSPASVLYSDEEKMLSKENLMGDYLQGILPDKIRLDRLYVRHRSFVSDLDTIFWTIAIILPRLSIIKIPERYFFAGPLSRLINRYLNWFVVDMAVSMGAVYVANLFMQIGDQPSIGTNQFVILAVGITLLFSGINSFTGLNKVLWSEATAEDAVGLIVSSAGATVLLGFLIYLESLVPWLQLLSIPTIIILIIGSIAGIGFVTTRYRLRLVTSIANRWLSWRKQTSKVGERVLIVGLGENSQIVNWLLKRRIFRTAFSIVGIVDNNNPRKHGMRISGSWMLGSINEIPELIEEHDVGVILSTLPQDSSEIADIFKISQKTNTRLIFFEDLMWMINQQATRKEKDKDSSLWMVEHLKFKSMHDIVTELPNRFLLRDRLRQSVLNSKRYDTNQAILFVDFEGIDSLKESNTNSRKILNETLREVALRLNITKRESDSLGHFNENSFALILEHVSGKAEVEKIGRRFYKILNKPFDFYGHTISFEPHISVCTREMISKNGQDPEDIEISEYYENREYLEISDEQILGK